MRAVTSRTPLGRDEAHRAAVDEALAAMRHGMTYVATALTFEFTMATLILTLIALVTKDSTNALYALETMPREFKFIGAFLILATIVVPIFAQFPLCRATRRHDIARRVQSVLFRKSGFSRLEGMPNSFELAELGVESSGFAQYILAFCAALGIVGLAAWFQCVDAGCPEDLTTTWILYVALAALWGWAILLQCMAFQRSVTRHRIEDLAGTVPGPVWVQGFRLIDELRMLARKCKARLARDFDTLARLREPARYNDASRIPHDVGRSFVWLVFAFSVWCGLAHHFGRPSRPPQMQGIDGRSGLRWEVRKVESPLVVVNTADIRQGSAHLLMKRTADLHTEDVPLHPAYVGVFPDAVHGDFIAKVRCGTTGLVWSGRIPCPPRDGVLVLDSVGAVGDHPAPGAGSKSRDTAPVKKGPVNRAIH